MNKVKIGGGVCFEHLGLLEFIYKTGRRFMIERYRRKSEKVYDCIKYTGVNRDECIEFIGRVYSGNKDALYIESYKGKLILVQKGEWIIKYDNRYGVCSGSVFELLFDKV